VGDFMGKHRGDFVLALGSEHQPIHADIAAQRGKGIDLSARAA
jgi:hypothetical protein